MNLTKENVSKKNIFITLEDILIKGEVNQEIDKQKTDSVMSYLSGMQENEWITLFLVTGLHEEKAKKLLGENGLYEFFNKENCFYVTKDYIHSKEEIDRQRHLQSLEQDPYFVDEYFKQKILMDFFEKETLKKEETVLIGHDIWFDGFYSMRFSKVDFVLVEKSLSDRNKLIPERIQGLTYIDFSQADLKKLILGKFPQADLRYLETYTFNILKEQLFQKGAIDKIIKVKKDSRK